MKIQTMALMAALSLAALSPDAEAKRPGGPGAMFGGDFGPGFRLERMADHLDLTEDQRQAVSNIIEAAKPEFKALREQARANRDALKSLAADDPQINDIALSNGQLATEGTLLAMRVRGEVYAVLTDEQIAKLEKSRDRMRKRMEER